MMDPLIETAPRASVGALDVPSGPRPHRSGISGERTTVMVDDTPTHCHTSAAPQAPVDGCPECVRTYTAPVRTATPDAVTLIGVYRCPSCGHTWWTSWEREGA